MVDKYLDDMVHATGRGVRFAVELGTDGGIWSYWVRGFMGGMLPLMSARGLVRVLPLANREGLRYIW